MVALAARSGTAGACAPTGLSALRSLTLRFRCYGLRTLKGRLAAALVLGLSLMLVPAHANQTERTSTAGTTAATPPEQVCWTNHNGRTRERVFQFLTDISYEPFSFVNSKGELKGIDVDLLKAWAKSEGMTIRICARDFASILTQLKNKQADGALASISYTVKRSQYLDFSQSYFAATEAVVALDTSGIKTLEDLKGKTVAVKAASVGEIFAQQHQEEWDLKIRSFDTSFEALLSVNMGQSDFSVGDYPIAVYHLSSGLYPGLVIAIDRLPVDHICESFHFVAPKSNDKALVKAFNQGLARLIDNGEYRRIIKTYLENFAEPVPGPHLVPAITLEGKPEAHDQSVLPHDHADL